MGEKCDVVKNEVLVEESLKMALDRINALWLIRKIRYLKNIL